MFFLSKVGKDFSNCCHRFEPMFTDQEVRESNVFQSWVKVDEFEEREIVSFKIGRKHFQVFDGKNVSLPANICVRISSTVASTCETQYPQRQLALNGDGFGDSNKTLQVSFIGNLIKTSSTTVTACKSTPLSYSALSTVGIATCKVNGVARLASGVLAPGDTLICTNKPKGSDTDKFIIFGG